MTAVPTTGVATAAGEIWWVPLVAAVLAWWLTGVLRRYAVRHLMDLPTDRSSHSVPTPRGGGVGIVLAFGAGLVALRMAGALAPGALLALAGAGGWVALVGFLDDHGHVAAQWRLLAHAVGAAAGLAALGGLPPLPVLGTLVDLGWVGDAVTVVSLVWLLNLYNFMDGIDGLAGAEAVSVGAGGALVAAVAVPGAGGWLVPALLAGAAAGFLVWNAPPARIFMGDAGSGFLGLTLGLLAVRAAGDAPELFWAWSVLLGAFVVDATVTLLRRAAAGERVYEAHRTHAYQYAARRIGRHRPVTLAVVAVNVCWLTPLALLVATRRLDGVAGVLVAYAPLVWVAVRYKAGARRFQEV